MANFYEVLGITKEASAKDIKTAYRKLAFEHHPDRNPGDPSADTRFKEVQEAYNALGDTDKRNEYDRYGSVGKRPSPNSGGFWNFNFNNFSNHQVRGENIQIRLEIDLGEAFTGVKKKVYFKRKGVCGKCRGSGGKSTEICSKCNGLGKTVINDPPFRIEQTCTPCFGQGTVNRERCDDCLGTGFTPAQEFDLDVEIPPGFDNGMQMRYQYSGEPCRSGTGTAGDLYVVVFVREHPVYKRVKRDLVYDIWLSYTQLIYGTDVWIKKINGEDIKIAVPPGTNPGSHLRLKGQGITDHLGFTGDLLGTVRLELPSKLPEDYRKTLEKLIKHEKAHVTSERQRFADNHK